MTEIVLLHNILDQAARRYPDSPAVTGGCGTRSYRELSLAARAAGAWLRSQNLKRGDRIVIQADLPQLPELVFASSRLGLVAVPLHDQVKGGILRHVLRDSKPGIVITANDSWIQTARGLDISAIPAVAMRHMDVADHMEDTAAAGDPVLMIYTSGSTAMPKAVVTTHAQAMFSISAIGEAARYKQTDIVFSALPHSFDYGLYQLFLAAKAGCHLWLATGIQRGPGLLAALRQSHATILPAVPSMLDILVRQLRRGRNPGNLRLVTTTGAAVPADVLRAVRQLVPQVRIQVMYGLTECKRATIMPPDGDLQKPGSSGLPLAGTHVFAVDPSGNVLPPNGVGELVVCGPNVMAGYWRDPPATNRVFSHTRDGTRQLRTGDFGYVDDEGYVYVNGRKDSVFKVRGFRVSAAEVVQAARTVPGVRNAAVLPPSESEPEPLLIAVADIESSAILMALREQLEDFKIPGQCEVVKELPLNSNGKVDLPALAGVLRARSAK